MVGSCKYEISQRAYVKLVLHALKHPCTAASGVLVGTVTESQTSNGVTSDHAKGVLKVDIDDAVPLFHSQHGLLPMLELSLSQVEEHYKAGEDGFGIVGYYHANERFDDYDLSPLARRIGDHISRHTSQAALLLLDNRSLGSLGKGANKKPVVQLYTRDAVQAWRENGDLFFKEVNANSILSDYISEKRERLIVDFDDHLADVNKDWLNDGLFRN